MLFSMILALASILVFVAIMIFGISNTMKKINKENKEIEENEKRHINNINKLKKMSVAELLKKKGLEEYCEIFEKNKIETIEIAIKLTEDDLASLGIELLGARKNIIALFEKCKRMMMPEKSAEEEKIEKLSTQNEMTHLILGILVLAVWSLISISGMFGMSLYALLGALPITAYSVWKFFQIKGAKKLKKEKMVYGTTTYNKR